MLAEPSSGGDDGGEILNFAPLFWDCLILISWFFLIINFLFIIYLFFLFLTGRDDWQYLARARIRKGQGSFVNVVVVETGNANVHFDFFEGCGIWRWFVEHLFVLDVLVQSLVSSLEMAVFFNLSLCNGKRCVIFGPGSSADRFPRVHAAWKRKIR